MYPIRKREIEIPEHVVPFTKVDVNETFPARSRIRVTAIHCGSGAYYGFLKVGDGPEVLIDFDQLYRAYEESRRSRL